MVAFTNADLQMSGLTLEESRGVANPTNSKHIERQQRNLLLHRGRYLGIFAAHQALGGDLQAFVKYNEWRTADQIPYAEGNERETLQNMLQEEKHHLMGRPLGIFALTVSQKLPQDTQLALASNLAYEVLAKNRAREVRIGIHENDPLKLLLTQYEFESTGRYGEVIPGVEQELYIRDRFL